MHGTLGGVRGLTAPASAKSASVAAEPAAKRQREVEKPKSEQERLELERREAARKRVQARTMASFGLT